MIEEEKQKDKARMEELMVGILEEYNRISADCKSSLSEIKKMLETGIGVNQLVNQMDYYKLQAAKLKVYLRLMPEIKEMKKLYDKR